MMISRISLDSSALTDAIKGNIAEHARNLGISRGHLNNILKGRKKPSANLLLKIQSIYNLSAKKISKQDT